MVKNAWNPKQACTARRIDLELFSSNHCSSIAISARLSGTPELRYTVQCILAWLRQVVGRALLGSALLGKIHGRDYFSPQHNINGAKLTE